MIHVKFKPMHHLARVPEYAKEGDSGCDLRFCEDTEGIILFAGETRVLWTGIALEMEYGYEAQVRPRSSLSRVGLLVHLGTIDNGYRGQIGVTLTNTSREMITVRRGDRIAQLVFAKVQQVLFERVDELGESARGEGGYGSTGRA
jgi:dUTP pyrophosphatase